MLITCLDMLITCLDSNMFFYKYFKIHDFPKLRMDFEALDEINLFETGHASEIAFYGDKTLKNLLKN